MRGKGPYHFPPEFLSRITPAYAGKSTFAMHKNFDQLGSPPPMRGKAPYVLREDLPHGITPAYAGKSCGSTNAVTM